MPTAMPRCGADLIEAALEDWKDAHAHLEQAGPVLNRYPIEWQARAPPWPMREAALGMGRLELADAALQRLPRTLDARQALEAELDQARLMAAENRYARGCRPFRGGGEERRRKARGGGDLLSHQRGPECRRHHRAARPSKSLNGCASAGAAIVLELQDLAQARLALFRPRPVARRPQDPARRDPEFQRRDAARVAQDDMRGAFVNLFLKGGADKMPPVEALAMFYDNLDLTPIGPDGDEMIRRMSDRLVAVDLLGPAENLLAYQVDKRLDGVAKAQVATRLAAVYLMDHKADKAVATLRDSQITGLPDDEMHNRLILEARAFAALKQWDNALDLIAVDQSEDTQAPARRHLLGNRQLGGGRPEGRGDAGHALERSARP